MNSRAFGQGCIPSLRTHSLLPYNVSRARLHVMKTVSLANRSTHLIVVSPSFGIQRNIRASKSSSTDTVTCSSGQLISARCPRRYMLRDSRHWNKLERQHANMELLPHRTTHTQARDQSSTDRHRTLDLRVLRITHTYLCTCTQWLNRSMNIKRRNAKV